MAAARLKATLIGWREIAPDTRHFVFETCEPLRFRPGQFLSLRARIDEREVRRAYSIASAPDARRFELCLNRVREGVFSPYLFDLPSGATVEMQGPYGVFAWREPARISVLVATGTGIAPLRGMLWDRLPADREHAVTLVYGARYEEGLLYRGEFEQFERTNPNFRFWPTLTRPGPAWTGRQGRVQPHVLEAAGSRRDLDVYICGLKEMVEETRNVLLEKGLDRKQIIFERYD